MVWDCCFTHLEELFSHNTKNHWIQGGVYDKDYQTRRERLAEIMLGIIPPDIGGDVRDWEKVFVRVFIFVYYKTRTPHLMLDP